MLSWDARVTLVKCIGFRSVHRHVSCWNCGAGHCLLAHRGYACLCGCQEHECFPLCHSMPGFDREFAARMGSPA